MGGWFLPRPGASIGTSLCLSARQPFRSWWRLGRVPSRWESDLFREASHCSFLTVATCAYPRRVPRLMGVWWSYSFWPDRGGLTAPRSVLTNPLFVLRVSAPSVRRLAHGGALPCALLGCLSELPFLSRFDNTVVNPPSALYCVVPSAHALPVALSGRGLLRRVAASGRLPVEPLAPNRGLGGACGVWFCGSDWRSCGGAVVLPLTGDYTLLASFSCALYWTWFVVRRLFPPLRHTLRSPEMHARPVGRKQPSIDIKTPWLSWRRWQGMRALSCH